MLALSCQATMLKVIYCCLDCIVTLPWIIVKNKVLQVVLMGIYSLDLNKMPEMFPNLNHKHDFSPNLIKYYLEVHLTKH